MQGQKSAIGSSSEGLPLEHGSTSSDSGVVEQQICWTNFIRNPPINTNQETQNLSMWSMGESSSSSMRNQVSYHHEPPASMLSLGDVNMNMTHNHATNDHHYGHNDTANPSAFIGMKPSNYASSSSSGPFEIEARQRPCKRKAAELTIGQSSSGIISSNVYQSPKGSNDSNRQLDLVSSDPNIPRLGPGPGPAVGVFPDNRVEDNNRRNVRIRINNPRHQDQLPASGNNNNISGQLNFLSPYPSLGLNPVATIGESSSNHERQTTLRVPALRRNLQVTSRNRSSSSRANRSVSSSIIRDSGDNSRSMPANISDHPLFVQPHDIRNTAQTGTNWNPSSSGGNGNGIVTNNGNAVPSATNLVASLGPRHGSSLYPSRRLSEVLRWSLLPSVDSSGGGGGQSGSLFSRLPPPVGTSASSSQESGIPRPVIGTTGHHPHHLPPHLMFADRPFDGAFGLSHLPRTTAGGSERRGRLVSEMRNVLDLIRRGEGLRFEDVMVLDQSVFYGMAGMHDRHRDMRLDIDNMSYEELLALEERIGNVNTGLTEDKLSKCLKPKTYASEAAKPDAEPCCICQEEYKNGDDLGALECGHDFHRSCIKQWLILKNLCPVCKSAASK